MQHSRFIGEILFQIPPPGKGSLYIRPLLMGSGAVLGLAPAPEYTFLIYVSPVGNYFKVRNNYLQNINSIFSVWISFSLSTICMLIMKYTILFVSLFSFGLQSFNNMNENILNLALVKCELLYVSMDVIEQVKFCFCVNQENSVPLMFMNVWPFLFSL